MQFIESLRDRLNGDLPGSMVQYQMAPEIRLENRNGLYRNAAVLVMLYLKENEWHILFMKRPEYSGIHSNQVSFPGGKSDDKDKDLSRTALRETEEETGIAAEEIELIGSLTPLHIPVSGIEVTPYVGVGPEHPSFRPDPLEVAYLIEAPLAKLVDPSTKGEDVRTIHCKLIKVPYYAVGKDQVWGATAMMLSEFLSVVSQAGFR